jgi:putative ABC transport system substrate-binding protein
MRRALPLGFVFVLVILLSPAREGRATVFPLGAVLVAPLAAEAQQAGRVYRIGYMGTTPLPRHMWESFVTELRALGWIEGQNIIFERRFSEGRAERFKTFAEDFVRLKVDMILTAGGLPPAQAAKDATATLPIVLVTGGDPVITGLVTSLARPGGNITGLSMVVDYGEIHGKRLELLKEVAPKVSRVGFIYSTTASVISDLQKADGVARVLGVTLLPTLVNNPDEFADAFAAVTRRHADGLLVADAGINYLHRQSIAEFAARNRLPAIYAWREAVEAEASRPTG